ncbi:hypothetical protein ACP70R_021635 [Stipagrostis hirtigluma subsp. patula]
MIAVDCSVLETAEQEGSKSSVCKEATSLFCFEQEG